MCSHRAVFSAMRSGGWCEEVWGGIPALMEGADGVQYGSKVTEEVMGLLLTIHDADVP